MKLAQPGDDAGRDVGEVIGVGLVANLAAQLGKPPFEHGGSTRPTDGQSGFDAVKMVEVGIGYQGLSFFIFAGSSKNKRFSETGLDLLEDFGKDLDIHFVFRAVYVRRWFGQIGFPCFTSHLRPSFFWLLFFPVPSLIINAVRNEFLRIFLKLDEKLVSQRFQLLLLHLACRYLLRSGSQLVKIFFEEKDSPARNVGADGGFHSVCLERGKVCIRGEAGGLFCVALFRFLQALLKCLVDAGDD